MGNKKFELDFTIACIRMEIIQAIHDKKSNNLQIIRPEVESRLSKVESKTGRSLKSIFDDKYGQDWTDKHIENNIKEIAEHFNDHDWE